MGESWLRILNPVNGYNVELGFDAVREWSDDPSFRDGLRHGMLLLKAQIILDPHKCRVEPLTESLLSEALKREPGRRLL